MQQECFGPLFTRWPVKTLNTNQYIKLGQGKSGLRNLVALRTCLAFQTNVNRHLLLQVRTALLTQPKKQQLFLILRDNDNPEPTGSKVLLNYTTIVGPYNSLYIDTTNQNRKKKKKYTIIYHFGQLRKYNPFKIGGTVPSF